MISPHATTAARVHEVLVAAGLPQVLPFPVPTAPLTGGAVIVGAPTLPEQAIATGCAPSEMVATVTVVAAGIVPAAVKNLYEVVDRCLSALLDAGCWNPSTIATTWTGQDMQPVPAITLSVSIGYPQE